MRGPVIGITMSYHAEERNYFSKNCYAESIMRAGGVPFLIPADGGVGSVTCQVAYEVSDSGATCQITGVAEAAARYAAHLDGILFAGGGDIHPGYFGEELLEGFEMGELQPQRDEFEIRLYKEAEKRRLPMLGICRGIQLMAVAAGGSIYQDIDTGMERVRRIRHMQKAPDWCETHTVSILPDSRLAEIYHVEQIMTNSFHHQAVKEVPPGYRISARSKDGIIEAIEAEHQPFCIGVQWHPERTSARDEKTAELFQSFVNFATEVRREKDGEKA